MFDCKEVNASNWMTLKLSMKTELCSKASLINSVIGEGGSTEKRGQSGAGGGG